MKNYLHNLWFEIKLFYYTNIEAAELAVLLIIVGIAVAILHK